MTVTIPFLDSIINEIVNRFADDKREHFELRALIPETIKGQETAGVLKSKWKHLLPAEDNLDSELAPWKAHCNGIPEEKSVTQLLCQDADPIFFPNVRELLCILAVLPVGSAEAERSFSCLRQIHSWLHTTMADDRLGNLGVLALQGFDVQLNVQQICETEI